MRRAGRGFPGRFPFHSCTAESMLDDPCALVTHGENGLEMRKMDIKN
jgi:hypothetical protein